MSLSYTQRRLVEGRFSSFGVMTSAEQLQSFLTRFGRVFSIEELREILAKEGVVDGEVIPVSVCLEAVRRHRPQSVKAAADVEAFVAYGGRQDGTGMADDPSENSKDTRALGLQSFKERFREQLATAVGARTAQPSLYADLTSGTPRAGEELGRRGIKKNPKRVKPLNRVTRTESMVSSDSVSTLCSSRAPTGLVREEADECVDRHRERIGWMQGAIDQLLTFKSVQRPVPVELDGRTKRGLRRPHSASVGGRSLVPSLVEREALKLDRQIAALKAEMPSIATSPSNASTAAGNSFNTRVLPDADQLVRRVARSAMSNGVRPRTAGGGTRPSVKMHRINVLAPHLRKPAEYVGPVGSVEELKVALTKALSPLPIGHVVQDCYIVCGCDGDVRVSADTFRLLPSLCDMRVVTGVPMSSTPL